MNNDIAVFVVMCLLGVGEANINLAGLSSIFKDIGGVDRAATLNQATNRTASSTKDTTKESPLESILQSLPIKNSLPQLLKGFDKEKFTKLLATKHSDGGTNTKDKLGSILQSLGVKKQPETSEVLESHSGTGTAVKDTLKSISQSLIEDNLPKLSKAFNADEIVNKITDKYFDGKDFEAIVSEVYALIWALFGLLILILLLIICTAPRDSLLCKMCKRAGEHSKPKKSIA